jgi:hypothetical protein
MQLAFQQISTFIFRIYYLRIEEPDILCGGFAQFSSVPFGKYQNSAPISLRQLPFKSLPIHNYQSSYHSTEYAYLQIRKITYIRKKCPTFHTSL